MDFGPNKLLETHSSKVFGEAISVDSMVAEDFDLKTFCAKSYAAGCCRPSPLGVWVTVLACSKKFARDFSPPGARPVTLEMRLWSSLVPAVR